MPTDQRFRAAGARFSAVVRTVSFATHRPYNSPTELHHNQLHLVVLSFKQIVEVGIHERRSEISDIVVRFIQPGQGRRVYRLRLRHIPAWPHARLHLEPTLTALKKRVPKGRVLDAGCGNGAFCGALVKQGCYEVVGTDLAESGVAIARRHYPGAEFHVLSVQDDLVSFFGSPFDAVVSLEVIEHLYSPKQFVMGMFRAIRPGGTLIISTPYHGYLKNLALSITGKMDHHFTANWEGGTSNSSRARR